MPGAISRAMPVSPVLQQVESPMDFTSSAGSTSRRRAKKPQGGINKALLFGCGIPSGLVVLLFVLGMIGAIFAPDDDNAGESVAEVQDHAHSKMTKQTKTKPLRGTTKKMTKAQFKEKLAETMIRGQVNQAVVAGLWNYHTLMQTFGEPQSDSAGIGGNRYWTYLCRDGMAQLDVVVGPDRVIIQSMNTY